MEGKGGHAGYEDDRIPPPFPRPGSSLLSRIDFHLSEWVGHRVLVKRQQLYWPGCVVRVFDGDRVADEVGASFSFVFQLVLYEKPRRGDQSERLLLSLS